MADYSNFDNLELVTKGSRILLTALSGFIGQEMNCVYKNKWWDEILMVLPHERNLPSCGDYGVLLDSLDLANCIRIIDRKWRDVFFDVLSPSARSRAQELMGVRNIMAHHGQSDLDQAFAQRALDTMYWLCKEIDEDSARDIYEIYKEVRSRADDLAPSIIYSNLAQPESESKRGSLKEGSLLNITDTDIIEKTALTRKVTFNGKTNVYPVYKIKLNKLYYNDQNDRIATWISKYEAENGKDSLTSLNVDLYNRVIENFVYDSNPESINKTQKNIALVGQREPGVTLADGRVVDGNRRLTCLRRLQQATTTPLYFETVIMDVDIQADKKQIKLLELAIQHGEEKKVDYDPLDYAIGTYRDVVMTNLLTAEEYAGSTNEPVADVKKRIEVAKLVTEFLEHLTLDEQYFVARDYQTYDIFKEMIVVSKQLDTIEKEQLKTLTFNNIFMQAVSDHRKFIRDIKTLIRSNTYTSYFEEQLQIDKEIREKFDNAQIHTSEDVKEFVANNYELTLKLKISFENALQNSRKAQLISKPSENIQKSISLLMDIDPRLFSKLDPEEKETLKAEFQQLQTIAENFKNLL